MDTGLVISAIAIIIAIVLYVYVIRKIYNDTRRHDDK